jgi:hypothetical protein
VVRCRFLYKILPPKIYDIFFYVFLPLTNFVRFDLFTAVTIQFVVFCVVAPCSAVNRYQRFGGLCCLYLQGSLQPYTLRFRWAMGWMIGALGFESRRRLGIFLFTTASRPALGPTQPPIQRVPGALSLGVKRPGREADHSPPSSSEVKEWVAPYLHSPICLHGVVISWAQDQTRG